MDGEFNRARWNGGTALLNQRVCRLRPCDDTLDGAFLFHFLPSALKKIEDATPFVTVKHLSVGDIREIRMPLPPFAEQRRIAAILDKADDLRAKRRAALVQLDGLAQSVFVEMFGDPAENPRRWPIASIGTLLESATYGTSEKAGETGELPILRMGNITASGDLDLSDLKYIDLDGRERDRYTVRVGDVLFNRTNSPDLVGKSAVIRKTVPLAYAGYLIRLRVSAEAEAEYLGAFLNSAYAKRVLRGMCKTIIGMANINATEVQRIPVAVPPLLTQRTFAARVKAIELERERQHEALHVQDALFASLQNRAFRGEL